MAMNYGHLYVASVAFGAKDAHTVRAFLEADTYNGPSLIIAYSHCIAPRLRHGVRPGSAEASGAERDLAPLPFRPTPRSRRRTASHRGRARGQDPRAGVHEKRDSFPHVWKGSIPSVFAASPAKRSSARSGASRSTSTWLNCDFRRRGLALAPIRRTGTVTDDANAKDSPQ